MLVDSAAGLLLDWYDRNARRLPWRAPPGGSPPDPYRVWLSEVMLQQTTVAAVAPYYRRFVERWPTVEALAAADDAEVMQAWAGLGYYARARNMLACAREVAERHGGRFPDRDEALRALPGVGAYTAAAVAAIAFGKRAAVVDGNVERVLARLFAVAEPLPAARKLLRAHAARLTPADRPGDFAQGMMDLGATVCTPRGPSCGRCPLAGTCAGRSAGIAESLPVRPSRKARPVRHGVAFWLEAEGAVLVVRRPGSGLLGGMLALPTSRWTAERDPELVAEAPVAADWRTVGGGVRHLFTHFELRLELVAARLPERPAVEGEWAEPAALLTAGLPTVFRRAAAVMLGGGERQG